MPQIVINGLGLSGLSAYDHICRSVHSSPICISYSQELGGYTRTISIDRFKFDYTGHFLHLNHFTSPDQIGSRGYLYENEWLKYSKKSSVYHNRTFCDAPIQYNYHQLGDTFYDLVQSSLPDINNHNSISVSSNLSDFFVNTYGSKLSETFFIPYNTKLLDIDLSQISTSHIGRFFPSINYNLLHDPSANNIFKSYNDKFWYPTGGGISMLLKHFLHPNHPIISSIIHIDVKNRLLTLNTGEIVHYDILLSSIPLNILLNSIDLYKDSSNMLSASSQYAFHAAVRTENEHLLNNTWIYVPDMNTNVYRIGNYSQVNSLMSSNTEFQSLYVEIRGSSLNPTADALAFLFDNFAISPSDIVSSTLSKLNPGYVHYKSDSHKHQISQILCELRSYGIYSFGRYGSWEYISMEDSILQAISAVDSLNL